MDKERACIANGECRPRHMSKKDTKTWCRGRVGVEHRWEWRSWWLASVREPSERGYHRQEEFCTACERPRYRDAYWQDKDRAVCHCGTLMCRVNLARVDGGYGYAVVCEHCDYLPSRFLPIRYEGGQRVFLAPRKKCRCEIEAEKAAKREHYAELYASPLTPVPEVS